MRYSWLASYLILSIFLGWIAVSTGLTSLAILRILFKTKLTRQDRWRVGHRDNPLKQTKFDQLLIGCIAATVSLSSVYVAFSLGQFFF